MCQRSSETQCNLIGMLLAWCRLRPNKRRHKHHNGSSLVKTTKLLASFCGELAFAKFLASFGGELAFTKLSANLGGRFALDSKGKSQEDLDACILVDPAPGQGCRGKVNACKGL